MSKETALWLNTKTLIGLTDKRGTAWHYRRELQGDQSNHYPGPIPIQHVVDRLFNFDVLEMPCYRHVPATDAELTSIPRSASNLTLCGANGEYLKAVPSTSKKTLVASDDFSELGIVGIDYKVHPYELWLLEHIASILGDELVISSAGLLQNRALAWVEVSLPETIKTPEGVEFLGNFLAGTSLNGSISSTYKNTAKFTVCDNTFAVAIAGTDRRIKFRHTSGSDWTASAVTEALQIITESTEAFSAEIRRLCQEEVNPARWASFLDAYVPLTLPSGEPKVKRALTLATNKRDELATLWSTDARVSPWAGTAFGVLQAVNTWTAHFSMLKSKDKDASAGVARALRNAENDLLGVTEKSDADTLRLLASV